MSMKLNPDFVTHTVDGEQIMVSVGGEKSFHGMVRSNRTAAIIIDLLHEEISFDQIVEKLKAQFDAPEDQIASDVKGILEKLRSIGALDE